MATIKNIERLQNKLDKIAYLDVEKAVKKATVFVHAQAKMLCPVDTGELRRSIHQEINDYDDKIEGRVFTGVEYAPYVEFGTGISGASTYPYDPPDIDLEYREDWVGMDAQPFLYPALKGSEKYVEYIIKDGVESKLSSICKGGK